MSTAGPVPRTKVCDSRALGAGASGKLIVGVDPKPPLTVGSTARFVMDVEELGVVSATVVEVSAFVLGIDEHTRARNHPRQGAARCVR